ncbi:glycosyltransferase [Methylorubrum extorquens]|nr:glycosyltransferase [Methylorubrum extorquens]
MPGFDEAYYLEHNPSVRNFTGSPLQHYLQHGWRDGCDPSAGFSSSGYLAANPDVTANDLNPLAHFLKHGLAEGRGGWQKGSSPDRSLSIDQRASAEWFSDDNSGMPLIFMYWENSEIVEPPSASSWKSFYPNFRVFREEDVVPILPETFVDVFLSIKLPAAKSDMARIFLLREHGGLYVDAHVGPTRSSYLLMTLARLAGCNLMLFSRDWLMDERSNYFDLINGVIAARQGAPELSMIIDKMMTNVIEHWHKEMETSDYVQYDLFSLTGTWLLAERFLEVPALRPNVRLEFRPKVVVNIIKDGASSGFELYKFHSYRGPGNHWSERQLYERLFRRGG